MTTETNSEPAPRRRRIPGGLARMAMSLLIFLVLLEVALRLAPGLVPIGLLKDFDKSIRSDIARSRGLPTNDDVRELDRDDEGPPLLLWKPGATITRPFDDPGSVPSITVDEQGFANPEGLYARESFDVIAIGDSFTFPTNVEPIDAWPHHLAKEGEGRSVYNLGKDAVGLHEYIQILKALGLAKKPSVVIMNVYEGNDLRDAIRYEDYKKNGGPDDDESEGFFSALSTPFRHSYALNLVGTGISSIAGGFGGAKTDFRYTVTRAGGEKVMINGDNGDRDEVATARSLTTGELSLDPWDAPLAEFAALSKTHGFKAVVAYSPSAYTAHAETVRFEDPTLRDFMPAFSDAQRTWLAAAAARHRLAFIDLTPALQAAAKTSTEGLYFPLNRHYSQPGHRLVAKTLFEAIDW